MKKIFQNVLTKNASSFLAQAFFLKTLGKGTNEQRCPFCLAFGIKEQRLLRDNTHPKVRRHGSRLAMHAR